MAENPGDSKLWKWTAIVATGIMSVVLSVASFFVGKEYSPSDAETVAKLNEAVSDRETFRGWVHDLQEKLAAKLIIPPPAPDATVRAEPELVIVTDAAGKRVSDAAVETAANKLAVGTWNVLAIPKPGDTGWTRLIVVSDGTGPVVPPVIPPVVPPVVPPVIPPVVPPVIPPVIPPPVVPVFPAPTAEMQSFVAPIKTLAAGNQHAQLIGKAWRDFAAVLRTTPPADAPKTTGELRTLIQRYEAAIAPHVNWAGKMPGFSAAASAAMASALGLDDTTLNLPRAAEVLEAIAWACGN